METAASARGVNRPVLHDGRAGSNGVDSSVRRQLLAELDSALGFADYCCFIGQEQVSSGAEELVSIAHKLYEDTLSAIGHAAGPRSPGARTHASS